MNVAYPLIPVTLITILAYLATWLFSRWEIFAVKVHRKFWNYLLLLTFIVSGLLGLLAVVKVNYKLEIPGYDTYMQWHVSFGIAMVFISFFHLSWHLKYYFSFTKKQKKPVKSASPRISPNDFKKFKTLLIFLGFISVINQVIFIREFINVLSGNELVVGIIMAAWMLLTGWGAYSGRKANFSGLKLTRGINMIVTLSLMPPVLIAVLYFLKDILFPPGTIVSLGMSVVAAFLLLSPVCYLSGYLFTAFSTLLSESKKTNLTGKAYSFESIGSLIGGLIFTIFLGRFFNSFQIFAITAAFLLFGGAWLMHTENRKLYWKYIVPGILIPTLIFVFNPDNFIKKMLFPNQELVSNQSTRYGNLVVTQQAGQMNVYENNDLQFYTENVMMNEEAVHFAMVQHENPKNVLLISGGISGMIKEIEKYGVQKITYLESNPEIFRTLKKYPELLTDTGNVEIVKSDIRSFIGKSKQTYDVILMNLPPPISLGLNRFYTEEFFQLLKNHCNSNTVICTSLPTTANYAEQNALEVNSSLWKTIGLFFKNKMLMPGEKNYFLASDRSLSPNITEKISEKNISTEYVNQYYLDDILLSMRSQALISDFKPSIPVNRDFYPYMFIKEIGHWLSHFKVSYKLLILIPVLLFLIFFFKTNSVTAGLYTGGFTAASLEVALLLAYQIYFGSIYLATASFFAIFMAGLAFGSSLKPKTEMYSLKKYAILQFAIAVFSVVVPFLIQLTGKIAIWTIPAQIFFFVLIFILATGIGLEFLMASKLRQKNFSETSGVNYSTDLTGSAFGAFLTSIILLPLVGLLVTCLIVASLNLVSGTLAFSAGRKGTVKNIFS